MTEPDLTHGEATLISARITDLRSTIDDKFLAVDRRFDEVNTKVDRVEGHTSATNGRVGRLELAQATVNGIRMAFRWVPAMFIGVVTAGVGTGVGVLLATLLQHH